MKEKFNNGPLYKVVHYLDYILDKFSFAFLVIANICLGLMLVGTFATIFLRLFNISFYWIWPWTMQLFVWMTFFGFYVVYRQKKKILL
jgi:TRAP-type C4-dicarboxylate transport system permease small subunit